MRGATRIPAGCAGGLDISIHAPHAGCEQILALVDIIHVISIHAPHAGCDDEHDSIFERYADFNPRTPCGVRHGGHI